MNRDERDLDQLHVVLRYCDRLEELSPFDTVSHL